MCNVECAEFVFGQRRIDDIALSHFEDAGFAVSFSLTQRFRDLFLTSLPADNRHAVDACDRPRELPKASAEIDNALAHPETPGPDAAIVETYVFGVVMRCCSALLAPRVHASLTLTIPSPGWTFTGSH